MQNELLAFHKQANLTRFHSQTQGHYESFFLRANHPTRPLAFWIRYTLFSPKNKPENNIGELWATFFNGESNKHTVVKQEYPLRHTDLYAWGQVAGFESNPDSFLEIATAKLKLGPFWTPPITLLVLRHNQKEYALTELLQGIKARGKFRYFTWEFKSKTTDVEIEGEISAPSQAFIGLNYYNPPGGNKYCLNSKIAKCKLHFKDKTTGKVEILETKHRAAFEILTNDQNHGITISA